MTTTEKRDLTSLFGSISSAERYTEEPVPLAESLVKFRRSTEENFNFHGAVEACRESRWVMSGCLDRYIIGEPMSEHELSEVINLFNRYRDSLSDISDWRSLFSSTRKEKLDGFRRNIDYRINALETLRDKGLEAAQEYLIDRSNEFRQTMLIPQWYSFDENVCRLGERADERKRFRDFKIAVRAGVCALQVELLGENFSDWKDHKELAKQKLKTILDAGPLNPDLFPPFLKPTKEEACLVRIQNGLINPFMEVLETLHKATDREKKSCWNRFWNFGRKEITLEEKREIVRQYRKLTESITGMFGEFEKILDESEENLTTPAPSTSDGTSIQNTAQSGGTIIQQVSGAGGDQYMRDVKGMDHSSISGDQTSKIDFPVLEQDIGLLISNDGMPEDLRDILEKAKDAAAREDREGTLSWLKQGGKRLLDVAQGVSVRVISEIIKNEIR